VEPKPPTPERNARRDAGAAAIARLVAKFLVSLDPHMRKAGLPKAEHARRGGRDVNDPAANEWSSIDDFQDGAAAVVEIDHPHSRSHRKGFVGGDQAIVMRILVV
jgi:hypothetical protein